MFKQIQYRLLISYLLVFASILGTFAIVVRLVFAHSLRQQFINRLTELGQSAVSSAEVKNGRLEVGQDVSTSDLIAREQALQWFDSQRHLITQQGKAIADLPLSDRENLQIQLTTPRIQVVTLPILSSHDRRLVGYVRASQSLEEIDESLRKLDLGLGGGVLLALILSAAGGVWLTRQAMQPIEASFQQLKQFTADASHELRSPLMAIKSNVSVALKYPEGMRSSDVEKFSAIESATNQMKHLTEDLLLLARSDRASIPQWQTVNLTIVLEQLVQLYQQQAEVKQLRLQPEIAPDLTLIGDAIQLTRLFTNLITNALHYTEQGTITVQATQTKQWLIVKVNDTGIGIAPEDLPRVFDRFWRADAARSYEGGSGLGLAIAQTIVQAHRGTIEVKSQLESGSCFTVRLPIAI